MWWTLIQGQQSSWSVSRCDRWSRENWRQSTSLVKQHTWIRVGQSGRSPLTQSVLNPPTVTITWLNCFADELCSQRWLYKNFMQQDWHRLGEDEMRRWRHVQSYDMYWNTIKQTFWQQQNICAVCEKYAKRYRYLVSVSECHNWLNFCWQKLFIKMYF